MGRKNGHELHPPEGIIVSNPLGGSNKRGLTTLKPIKAGTGIYTFHWNIALLFGTDTGSGHYRGNSCAYCFKKHDEYVVNNDLIVNNDIIPEPIKKQKQKQKHKSPPKLVDTLSTLKKCENCHYVSYCNEICFAKDYNFHKYECEFITKYGKKLYSNPILQDDERMILRLLIYCSFSKRNYSDIIKLTSHYEQFKIVLKNEKSRNFTSFVKYLETFKKEAFSNCGYMNHDSDFIYKLIGITFINVMNFNDMSLNHIGICFESTVSLINHSCEPNCCIKYLNDGNAEVIALKNFQKNEELFITYEFLGVPTYLRKESLQRYCFNCACDICNAQYDRLLSFKCWKCEIPIRYDVSISNLTNVICDNCFSLITKESLLSSYNDYYEVLNNYCGSMFTEEEIKKKLFNILSKSDENYFLIPLEKIDRVFVKKMIKSLKRLFNNKVIPIYIFPISRIISDLLLVCDQNKYFSSEVKNNLKFEELFYLLIIEHLQFKTSFDYFDYKFETAISFQELGLKIFGIINELFEKKLFESQLSNLAICSLFFLRKSDESLNKNEVTIRSLLRFMKFELKIQVTDLTYGDLFRTVLNFLEKINYPFENKIYYVNGTIGEF